MVNIAVIGCGYWGPNLIRNFVACPDTQLLWACDLDQNRLNQVMQIYPNVRRTTDFRKILADPEVDALVIATPTHTHYLIAKAGLESNKHVLIEKPLASTIRQGEELVRLAHEKGLQIMCDHTFCYAGSVRKIKEIIDSGTLGELYYYDSVRINLGLFQSDINVVWDLAPHDLSIVDFLVDQDPILISSHGVSHAQNGIENIAYVTLTFPNNFLVHLHLNWLSPVKIRKTIICGSEKMLVWNDLVQDKKIEIYDKGVESQGRDRENRERLMISYRSGDMYAPSVDQTEALSLVVKEFADCVLQNRPALTDGEAGLRVLRILNDAERSLNADGANVQVTSQNGRENAILSDFRQRAFG